MPLCAPVYMCRVVTCWEGTDLLALVCGVLLLACYFPICILGQVWYLIVSIPDLCTLTFIDMSIYMTMEITITPECEKSGVSRQLFLVINVFHRVPYGPPARSNWTQGGLIVSREGPYKYF